MKCEVINFNPILVLFRCKTSSKSSSKKKRFQSYISLIQIIDTIPDFIVDDEFQSYISLIQIIKIGIYRPVSTTFQSYISLIQIYTHKIEGLSYSDISILY